MNLARLKTYHGKKRDKPLEARQQLAELLTRKRSRYPFPGTLSPISLPQRPMRKLSSVPAAVVIPSAWPMPKSQRLPQFAGSAWRPATKRRLLLPAFPSSTRGR